MDIVTKAKEKLMGKGLGKGSLEAGGAAAATYRKSNASAVKAFRIPREMSDALKANKITISDVCQEALMTVLTDKVGARKIAYFWYLIDDMKRNRKGAGLARAQAPRRKIAKPA